MRIIAGRYRGRHLSTVDDLSVRPATDRVRQTVFDMLATRIVLEGAEVLDLFAGSGSLGFEAISRGARHATFVEQNREAIPYIYKTADSLGCRDAVTVLQMDAMRYAREAHDTYTLVFADPPYAFADTERLPAVIMGQGLVRPGGYLLIEHAHPHRFSSTSEYVAGPEKQFGRTLVTFFQQRKSQ